MIEKLKENEMRPSAVIFQSTLEQIRKIYPTNPQLAAELAIATIEMALTGETSSDDLMIEAMLAHFKHSSSSNAIRYDKRKENTKQTYITKNKLDEIAELYNQGYKQIEIANKLNIPKSTIHDKIVKIKEDFPELLSGNIKKSGKEIPDSDGFKQEADNSEISKNPGETEFEPNSKNPGDSKNPENSAVSEKQPNNLSGPDTDSDGKSGNEADFIEKTGFIF